MLSRKLTQTTNYTKINTTATTIIMIITITIIIIIMIMIIIANQQLTPTKAMKQKANSEGPKNLK